MERPVVLQKNQVIMTDAEQIIAIYPYRDSDTTKVTQKTRNIRIITCGVPNIGRENYRGVRSVCRIPEGVCGGRAGKGWRYFRGGKKCQDIPEFSDTRVDSGPFIFNPTCSYSAKIIAWQSNIFNQIL